jgi:hypothetical protein
VQLLNFFHAFSVSVRSYLLFSFFAASCEDEDHDDDDEDDAKDDEDDGNDDVHDHNRKKIPSARLKTPNDDSGVEDAWSDDKDSVCGDGKVPVP